MTLGCVLLIGAAVNVGCGIAMGHLLARRSPPDIEQEHR